MPTLTHKIALIPTREQREYFAKASGTARMVCNWALAEWNRQYALGIKPNAMALKKQFNTIKYIEFPWLKEIHRDAQSQPFANLGKAWNSYFRELKKGTVQAKQSAKRSKYKPFDPDLGKPKFKKKSKCTDSFYVANDKLSISGKTLQLPKIGKLKMTESLRFAGKILGATVSRQADTWSIAIQVEVDNDVYYQKRLKNKTIGIDLGITSAVTQSDGLKIQSPKPLKTALRRLKIRQKRLSRKIMFAKKQAGYTKNEPLPKGTRLPKSNSQSKLSRRIAKTHQRITNIRLDFTHKLTTKLCRENQTIVMEDLNVQGMMKNHRLSQAISDIGFSNIRSQLDYKSKRYGTNLIFADQWFPSTKMCSCCGFIKKELKLSERRWTCPNCNASHDRDINAAKNLRNLVGKPTLPLASLTSDGNAVSGMVSDTEGEVTSVSYEYGYQSDSGQEQNFVHFV